MYGLFTIFKWVVTSSFMASVLICTILLVKKIFNKKLGIAWHYYIWILLFIRLLVPYAPQSSLSIFNLIAPMIENRVQPMNEGDLQNNILLNYDIKNDTANSTTNQNVLSNNEVNNIKGTNPVSQTSNININLSLSLMFVWLLGAIVFSSYMFILNVRFRKRIKDNCQCTEKSVTKVFNECSKVMNVNKKLPVYFTKNIHSPSIYGLFWPRLLLPVNFINKISHEELKYIFLHELAHYKQKDILINWIAVVLKAIHWFNPIIWYGFYHMRQDCELACDAIALFHIEKENQVEYGRTIIHLLSLVSVDNIVPSIAGILSNSSKLHIKRRITMITNFKKTSIKCVIAVVAIASAIGITSLTNAKPAIANNINSKSAISGVESAEINLLPQNAKDVATLWAEALNNRDGGLRFSLLTNELKRQEYETYSKIKWTIGGSSPWVVSYTVNETNKLDNDTSEFEIKYQMTTSEGKYDSHENITVKKFGSTWYVIKHENDIYMPEVTKNDSLDFPIGQPHKSSSLITKDVEGAVNLWAEALKHRNGAARYSILTSELKDQEYEKYNKMNWVIGGSSPWVTSYTIKQLNKIDDNTYEYEINYTMTDSTKTLYFSKENVTVRKLRNWDISKHDNYDYLPAITKSEN